MSDIIASAAPIEHPAGPHDPENIHPKMASDIAFWSKELGVSGQLLHEAIRVHGTRVETIRHAFATHQVSLSTRSGEPHGDHSR